MFFKLQNVTKENMLLNFVVSERGAGKTFSSLVQLIEDFIDKGDNFVYVRRTQSELDLALPALFTAIIAEGYFPENELRVSGENFFCDGKLMGRGIAISTAYKFKSVAFPKVKTILFDEFISESRSYLKDEVTKFLSLVESIGRMREITIVCLANQDTIFNPYYVYFGVKPASPTTPKTRFRNQSILIYQFISQEYRDAKINTRFGNLIKGTKYGNFMLENETIKDDYTFIDDLKGVQKTAFVNFTAGGKDITGYDYYVNGVCHVFFASRQPVDGIPTFNFDKQLLEEKTIDNIKKNPYIKRAKLYIDRGFVRFKDVPTKNLISELIL